MAWLSGWSYRESLTFDSNGISLSGNVTDKTVRVNMPSSDTDFWANVKADGTDVRFTSSDGSTLLSFEVESFDNTGDDAWYHVKIPTITSATDTVIYIYYGNAGATSGEDISNTWDSSYKGVWHLNEDKAAGAFADSTSNANNGTNNSTTTATGQIDKGRNVSMVTPTNISIADSNSLSFTDGAGTDTAMTITAWVKMTDATRYRIFSKGDNAANEGEYHFVITGGDTLIMMLMNPTTALGAHAITRTSTGTLTADEGSWIYLAVTYNGSESNTGIAFYKNGASFASSGGTSGTYTGMGNTTRAAYIGSYHNIGSEATGSGVMDEVTISATARSADWLIADYQSGLGTWLTVGTQENNPSPTINIPIATFNFTGKVPVIINTSNYVTIATPKVDFNFTGKVPTVSVLSNVVVPVPSATFNFSRFAPTIRTTDVGIAIGKVNFNFTGQAPTISVTGNSAIAIPNATFNFTGKVPSVLLTNTEEEVTWGLFDTNGNAITGATPTIKIRSRETAYILDWSDNTFKLAGGSQPSANMTELDATGFPGYYSKTITIGAWADGWYVAATTYSAGTPKQNGSVEFLVRGGQMVDSYNSTNLDVAVSTRLATASYTAPDNAGIAAIQAKTDNLPADPASEASIATLPTLATIEGSSVLAKEATLTSISGDITTALTYLIGLTKWKNNKLARTGVSGTTETWVLYDDDSSTPLLTWTHDTSNIVRSKAT